jgi:lipoyl(octanoyl) transferase
VLAVDFGRIHFDEALRWQSDLVEARSADRVDDVLMVCEHEPVYTAGRHADLGNVLNRSTFRLVRVDRGGDVTYHGPGQVVIYPILRLAGPRRVRSYVEALEAACIAVAAAYGIAARTVPGRPGVWVDDQKLAAIGVRIQRGATSHGLAFNVAPDLRHFAGIVPCGIADAGVCSLATLGVRSSLTLVARQLVAALSDSLARPVTWSTPQRLAAQIPVDDVA